MERPIRNRPYTFDRVPMTEAEAKDARKNGEKTKALRGTFVFRGASGKQKTVLVFKESATVVDGIVTSGRTVKMTPDDFSIGLDLGKIKAKPTKRARKINKIKVKMCKCRWCGVAMLPRYMRLWDGKPECKGVVACDRRQQRQVKQAKAA